MKKILLLLVLQAILFSNAYAELIIKIDKAEIGALPMMVHVEGSSERYTPDIFERIIENDLFSSGYFNILDSKNVKSSLSNIKTQYALWALSGSNYFLKASIFTENGNEFIKFKLHNVIKKETMISYKINLDKNNNIRKVSHKISNVIFESITGIEGIFDTKIAYISTEKSKERNIYKLHVADVDGFNSVAIYKSSKQLMSPTWSPKNNKIAYVSFENHRPEIFIQTLATGERVKLVNGNVSSSAPAWSPNEKFMAYTSSVNGNLEIFVHNLFTKDNRRITNSLGIDTEAEWGLKSKKIFFTSDRNGNPHIYSKSINNGKAKRITFEGTYNADGNLSSDGRYLSLVHNNGNGHKIAIYSFDDKFLKVISRGRLDEAPSFAPNGKMVLFASKKLNKGILVAASNDGRIRKEIELTGENVREPIWSH
jgi:TolB protein